MKATLGARTVAVFLATVVAGASLTLGAAWLGRTLRPSAGASGPVPTIAYDNLPAPGESQPAPTIPAQPAPGASPGPTIPAAPPAEPVAFALALVGSGSPTSSAPPDANAAIANSDQPTTGTGYVPRWYNHGGLPRTPLVSQFDGGTLQGFNCTMASGAMLARLAFGIVTNGSQLRSLQPKQVGGTSLLDLEAALKNGFGVSIQRGAVTPAQLKSLLIAGYGAVVQGDYGKVPNSLSLQDSFNGGHAVYVDAYLPPANGYQGAYWVVDPLGRPWSSYEGAWWPESVFDAFGTSFSGSSYIFAAWAPPGNPDQPPIKLPPNPGPGATPVPPPTPAPGVTPSPAPSGSIGPTPSLITFPLPPNITLDIPSGSISVFVPVDDSVVSQVTIGGLIVIPYYDLCILPGPGCPTGITAILDQILKIPLGADRDIRSAQPGPSNGPAPPILDVAALDSGPPDSGPPDSGPPDSGPPDLGPPDPPSDGAASAAHSSPTAQPSVRPLLAAVGGYPPDSRVDSPEAGTASAIAILWVTATRPNTVVVAYRATPAAATNVTYWEAAAGSDRLLRAAEIRDTTIDGQAVTVATLPVRASTNYAFQVSARNGSATSASEVGRFTSGPGVTAFSAVLESATTTIPPSTTRNPYTVVASDALAVPAEACDPTPTDTDLRERVDYRSVTYCFALAQSAPVPDAPGSCTVARVTYAIAGLPAGDVIVRAVPDAPTTLHGTDTTAFGPTLETSGPSGGGTVTLGCLAPGFGYNVTLEQPNGGHGVLVAQPLGGVRDPF